MFHIEVLTREYVQHVLESEQTQETTQDQVQETQEQQNNEEIGNPPEPQNLNRLVHVQQPMQQTCTERTIHKLARHALIEKMYQVTTYKEALEDVDVQEWKREMDHEMESMGSNSVWSLVEASRWVKPIRSKLIYKKKSLGKPCVHKRFKV